MQFIIKPNGDLNLAISNEEVQKYGILNILNNKIPNEAVTKISELCKIHKEHYARVRNGVINDNATVDNHSNDLNERVININLDNL